MPTEPSSPADVNKGLFLNLIAMLSISALQQLGKIINPATGKTEVSLDGAQATIDLLDMLEAKTRGNRDAAEDKALKDTLTMLKMNYVETGSAGAAEPQASRPERDPSGTGEQKGKGNAIQSPGTGTAKATETGDSQPQSKDPKYHKTYS